LLTCCEQSGRSGGRPGSSCAAETGEPPVARRLRACPPLDLPQFDAEKREAGGIRGNAARPLARNARRYPRWCPEGEVDGATGVRRTLQRAARVNDRRAASQPLAVASTVATTQCRATVGCGSIQPRFTLGLLVPEVGLEPTRACAHRCLRPTRLPIPPLRHREPSL
jgi:hypothetical protein